MRVTSRGLGRIQEEAGATLHDEYTRKMGSYAVNPVSSSETDFNPWRSVRVAVFAGGKIRFILHHQKMYRTYRPPFLMPHSSSVDLRKADPASQLCEALDDAPEIARESGDQQIAAIDDALKALAKMGPRKGKVVELRFFGGLSVEQTAAVLKIYPQSVLRDWKLARALG